MTNVDVSLQCLTRLLCNNFGSWCISTPWLGLHRNKGHQAIQGQGMKSRRPGRQSCSTLADPAVVCDDTNTLSLQSRSVHLMGNLFYSLAHFCPPFPSLRDSRMWKCSFLYPRDQRQMDLLPYRKQIKLNQEIPIALCPLFLTLICFQQLLSADHSAGSVHKELSQVKS